jgi:hypothetical protein
MVTSNIQSFLENIMFKSSFETNTTLFQLSFRVLGSMLNFILKFFGPFLHSICGGCIYIQISNIRKSAERLVP